AWQVKPRLEDMDTNWIEASLCFPTFPRFCGQTFSEAKDKDLALLCVQAYNDWMVDEWCGDSGSRLIPLPLIPLWDAELAATEGQIGWIPYILERADIVWEENRGWGGVADKVLEPPSQLFRKHVYGCFFSDAHGLRSLDEIGVDNVTYESDYPHSDSTWPNTRQIAERQL